MAVNRSSFAARILRRRVLNRIRGEAAEIDFSLGDALDHRDH